MMPVIPNGGGGNNPDAGTVQVPNGQRAGLEAEQQGSQQQQQGGQAREPGEPEANGEPEQ